MLDDSGIIIIFSVDNNIETRIFPLNYILNHIHPQKFG